MVGRLDPDTGLVVPLRDEAYDPDSPGPVVSSSETIYEWFKGMGELAEEHIVVGMMNVRGELTGWKVVHKGQLAAVEASPRKMMTDAFLGNAAGVFMLHNHPSGACKPSEADEDLTAHMVKVGEMLEIPLYDHVIVGRGDEPYYSFRDDGKIPETEEPS